MKELVTEPPPPSGSTFGFIDVVRTSDDWPAAPSCTQTGAYLSNRRRLPLPDGPITVERARVPAGAAGECRLPGDEFVLVLEGRISLEQSGTRCDLTAGEAGVAVRDRPLAWRSECGADLIVLRCTDGGGAGAAEPVRIDLDPLLSPSSPPAPEVLLGETPRCRSHTDYRSTSGEFACGVWDATPYQRRLVNFRHYELMRLLEGSVTFVDTAGRQGRFKAGDVILFVQGGGAAWESWEYVKKIFATFRPAE